MTDLKQFATEPLVLELNRVQRLYTGGKLLNVWQGLPPGEDGIDSEEFLISTAEYIGFGHPEANGLSRVKLSDGSCVPLRDIIASAPESFLGQRYSSACHGHAGVLTRVGDSNIRLVIQCHPNAEQAERFFHVPFGKTEAWVIADSRTINGIPPHLYCGFRPGVTRALWAELIQKQDVPAMLSCMYRFNVVQGDTILIPAGMPHAMGSGCLFIEIHEPCDYTIRPERNYLARPLSDEEMHYSLGFETMLDFFDYTTYTQEEIRSVCFPKAIVEAGSSEAVLTSLIRYENTPHFAVKRLSLHGVASLPEFDGHYVLISEHGSISLRWDDGTTDVPQGRGVFVPAGVHRLSARGEGSVLIAYPFEQPMMKSLIEAVSL